MNAESDVFKKLIQEFPADDAWDARDPLQKAYLAAGIKRYNLENLWQTYSNVHYEQKESEEFTVSKSSSVGAAAGFLTDEKKDGDELPGLKLEFPLAKTLKAKIPPLKAAKRHLLRLRCYV